MAICKIAINVKKFLFIAKTPLELARLTRERPNHSPHDGAIWINREGYVIPGHRKICQEDFPVKVVILDEPDMTGWTESKDPFVGLKQNAIHEPICPICDQTMESYDSFEIKDIGIELLPTDFFCDCCEIIAKKSVLHSESGKKQVFIAEVLQ